MPQPPSQPPAGTVAAHRSAARAGDARDRQRRRRWPAGWDLNANGHPAARCQSAQGAAGPEAVMNLGREEVLEDVRFDPASGRIEFYRPSGAQHYTGS